MIILIHVCLSTDKSRVVLGGDGRCYSPGYSAKYCSYSLIDLESNKIIDVQLVQVRCHFKQ